MRSASSGATAVTAVGAECVLTGTVVGKDLTVLGRFEGELRLEGRLCVGPKAHVEARVEALAVELQGEFEGTVTAVSLAFGETSRARGTFHVERLSMSEGAEVNGAFNLPPPEDATVPGTEEEVSAAAAQEATVAPTSGGGKGAGNSE